MAWSSAIHRYRFGVFVLDVAEQTLRRDGAPVEIQPKVFDMLRHLVERPGRLLSREALLAEVWPGVHVGDPALSQILRKVRMILGDEVGAPRYLETVPRRGYRFIADVIVEQGEPASPPIAPARAMPVEGAPRWTNRAVGRVREQAALSGRLGGGDRLITVHGPGGIGKTRLAWTVGQRAAWPMRWVRLAGLRADDELCERLCSGLGLAIPARDTSAALASLGGALALLGPVLVVLDGAEVVAPTLGRVLPRWMVAASEARFVLTSRRVLGLRDERVVAVAPLEDDIATALLLERAGVEEVQNLAVYAEIARALEGNPLAIELAAARLGLLSPEALLARLDSRCQLLRAGPDDEDRHASLTAICEDSWELLEAEDREALLQLAVFPGPMRLERAVGLLGHEALARLDRLHAHALIRRDGEHIVLSGTLRLFVLGLAEPGQQAGMEVPAQALAIRATAIGGLTPRGPHEPSPVHDGERRTEKTSYQPRTPVRDGEADVLLERAWQRLAAVLLPEAEALAARIARRPDAESQRALAALLPASWALLRRFEARDATIAARVLATMWVGLRENGPVSSLLSGLDQGIASEISDALRRRLLLARAEVHLRCDALDLARADVEATLRLCEGAPEDELAALLLGSWVARNAGENEAAVGIAERAWAIAAGLGPVDRFRAANVLALGLTGAGRLGEAETRYSEALDDCVGPNLERVRMQLLFNSALLRRQRGLGPRALSRFAEAGRICRALGLTLMEARVGVQRAAVLCEVGEIAAAEEALAAVRELFGTVADPYLDRVLRRTHAMCCLRAGRLDEAERELASLHEAAIAGALPREEGFAVGELGLLAWLRGDVDLALERLARADRLARRFGTQEDVALTRVVLAAVLRGAGQQAASDEALRESGLLLAEAGPYGAALLAAARGEAPSQPFSLAQLLARGLQPPSRPPSST